MPCCVSLNHVGTTTGSNYGNVVVMETVVMMLDILCMHDVCLASLTILIIVSNVIHHFLTVIQGSYANSVRSRSALLASFTVAGSRPWLACSNVIAVVPFNIIQARWWPETIAVLLKQEKKKKFFSLHRSYLPTFTFFCLNFFLTTSAWTELQGTAEWCNNITAACWSLVYLKVKGTWASNGRVMKER